MKKILLTALCVAGMAASQTTQAGYLTVSASIGGAPTGTERVNFDNLSPGTTATGLTATGPNGSLIVDIAADGQVASGSVSGKYAAPYLSGGNGTGFGSQSDGADTTPYLTTGLGSVTLTFGAAQQYMGLLWGSVDDYNKLSFYRTDGSFIESITGLDVLASPNGDQGVNGTLYVNINSTEAFGYVVASSTQYAFEFDNVAYNETPVGVPDGGSLLGVFALSLIGMATCARRRR